MSYVATLVKKIGTSGGDSIRVYDVTTDAATGNVTISDVDIVNVIGVVGLVEDSAANAQVVVQAVEDGTTKNKVNMKLWQAANSAAAAFKKCRLTLLCRDA